MTLGVAYSQRSWLNTRKAKIEPFGGNPLLANFLRHQAADEVQNLLGDLGAGLTVDGSAGAGNWAVAPWISAFDPAITTLETFWLLRIVTRINIKRTGDGIIMEFRSVVDTVSRQSDVYRSTNRSSGSRACGLKGGKSVAKS